MRASASTSRRRPSPTRWAAHRGRDRQAVARDRRRARHRSGQPCRKRGRGARHLQRHHLAWPVDERRARERRTLRPADLRSRPQLPGLSRLRRLPRRRACRSGRRPSKHAARASGASRAAEGAEPRPLLTLVPAAKNVVPFRGSAPPTNALRFRRSSARPSTRSARRLQGRSAADHARASHAATERRAGQARAARPARQRRRARSPPRSKRRAAQKARPSSPCSSACRSAC